MRAVREQRRQTMKQMAMRTKIMAIVGSTLVAVLALSGVAWAATSSVAVTKTVPTNGAPEIAPSADIMAYFNHDMNASSITPTTFVIREQNTTTGLGATRSVDNTISPTSANGLSESVVTLNPNENLASNKTYEVLIVGGRSGVKDVNGKTLRKTMRWTFTTASGPDTTPPDTIINDPKPANPTNSTSASFTFSGTDDVTPAGSLTFETNLDNQGWLPTDSNGTATSKTYSSLSDGSHTFQVRAKDAANNVDASPASYTWTVDAILGVTATPNPLNLSPDVFCTPRQEFLTVRNNGPGNVTFAEVTITGPDATNFSSGSQSALAGPLFFIVADGNFFQDQVTFRPGPTIADRSRSYQATLTYKDSTGATIGNSVELRATTACITVG
jgi:hypothetical protein